MKIAKSAIIFGLALLVLTSNLSRAENAFSKSPYVGVGIHSGLSEDEGLGFNFSVGRRNVFSDFSLEYDFFSGYSEGQYFAINNVMLSAKLGLPVSRFFLYLKGGLGPSVSSIAGNTYWDTSTKLGGGVSGYLNEQWSAYAEILEWNNPSSANFPSASVGIQYHFKVSN